MRTKILLLPAVLVLSVGVAALALAAGGGDMSPRPALVSAHGLTVRSTVGTYCVEGRSRRGASSGLCADAGSPLPVRGHLPVRAGDRVALRFRHNPRIHDRVASVRVTPMRVGASKARPAARAGRAVRADRNRRHPSRWHLRLPGRLHHADTLDIAIRYAHHHGDADFWAGIRSRG